MRIEEGEALLDQLKETKSAFIESIKEWVSDQPEEACIKTHLPMGLYATIYEGQPRKFLEGVQVTCVSEQAIQDWLKHIPDSASMKQVFSEWFGKYDSNETTPFPSQSLIASNDAIIFGEYSMEYSDMQLVELLQLYRFFIKVYPQKVCPQVEQPAVTSSLSLKRMTVAPFKFARRFAGAHR
ncbi:hypothetical protein ACFSJ3_06845 [Corallincola platygyrae]|uniref:Uncharacterized protein n=1 Tax=Corallincola platygyrae TaxID=1193278 RepID=A0ABW4XMH4_9GAMM